MGTSAALQPRRVVGYGSLFCEAPSQAPNTSQLNSSSSMTRRELVFQSSESEAILSPDEQLALPSIDGYLPSGTDHDTAITLMALYQSHCTSLIQNVRYMRLKQFFALFNSFHGTLTVPVQKLFMDPSIAAWIEECDWEMYKEMMRMLGNLALEVIPLGVLGGLRNLSDILVQHIRTTFQYQPKHVVEAKARPGTIFASLLDRLLKVNEAAHAAARMLSHMGDRTVMYKDWVNHVRAQNAVESELPEGGHAEVLRILTTEIPSLLQPPSMSFGTSTDVFDSFGTVSPNPLGMSGSFDKDSTTGDVLDRWTAFLSSLPERFPNVNPRTIISCVNGVGSAVLRDITVKGGEGFGGWWVVKCWVDEWMRWMAEKGGFMSHMAPSIAPATSLIGMAIGVSQEFDGFNDGFESRPRSDRSSNQSHSKFGSGDDDSMPMATANSSYNSNNGNTRPNSRLDHVVQGAMNSPARFSKDAHIDDSGISMGISDEDLAMGKYGFVSESSGVDTRSGANASGSDVVVC
jgi:regulatory factor X, other